MGNKTNTQSPGEKTQGAPRVVTIKQNHTEVNERERRRDPTVI